MRARWFTLGLAAALLLVACGGGSKVIPSPTLAGTATTVATPTTAAVTATASPTAAPSTGPVVLQIGMQGALGYDSVMYYTVGCFACGRPQVPTLYRVYATPDGQEHTDDLFAPLASYGGYVHSFAAEWERGDLWAVVCATGYCGGEAAPTPDAAEVLVHSKDGGIGWEPVSSLEPGATLAGVLNGLLYVSRYDPKSDAPVYRVLPSGDALTPPNGSAPFLEVVPGLGVTWRAAQGAAENSFLASDGTKLFEPKLASAYSFRLIAKTANGFLAEWSASAPGGPPQDIRVGYFDASGNLTKSWSWKLAMDTGESGTNYAWFEVQGELSANRLYATVLTPEWFEFGTDSPGITQEQLRHGRLFPMEIAFVNLDSATVHPVHGPSFNLTLNQNPFVVHVDTGPVARISTGADCLNVRTEPAAASQSLGCFRDGVLLRLRPEPDRTVGATTWRAVLTPDGQPGWASADFLDKQP